MSKSPLVYLASPYSSEYQDIIERRVRKVQDATARLIELGHLIFSPIVHTHPIADQVSFSPINNAEAMSGWMKYDYAMIDKADELWVLMIEGWTESRGVQAEIKHAFETNKPIVYIEYPTLKAKGRIHMTGKIEPQKYHISYNQAASRAEARRKGVWDTPGSGKPPKTEAEREVERRRADRIIRGIFGDDYKCGITERWKANSKLEGTIKTTEPIPVSVPIKFTEEATFDCVTCKKPVTVAKVRCGDCGVPKCTSAKTTKVIGLNGFAQTGKDTVGVYLVEKHGFKRIALADPVRSGVYALDPIVSLTPNEARDLKVATHCIVITSREAFIRLQALVDAVGWDRAKQLPEVRTLLQRYGTDAGRDIHGRNCWLNIAEKLISEFDKVVITDIRFANEAEFVSGLGGEVWEITRPGVTSVNGHASEVPLSDHLITYKLANKHSIDFLHTLVDSALECYGR